MSSRYPGICLLASLVLAPSLAAQSQFEEFGKEVLRVPEERRLLAILPIGDPASPPRQAVKKDLASITYLNNYGNPL